MNNEPRIARNAHESESRKNGAEVEEKTGQVRLIKTYLFIFKGFKSHLSRFFASLFEIRNLRCHGRTGGFSERIASVRRCEV